MITRSEAIKQLRLLKGDIKFGIASKVENKNQIEALSIAIVSLETDEAYQLEYEQPEISKGLFEQIKWERDIAIQQLHELGYEFGQKIEPTTKNDLPHCQCTNTEIAKSFIEDVEAVKDQLPTTKNDLGVDVPDNNVGNIDCISRADAIGSIAVECSAEKLDIDYAKFLMLRRAIKALPTVTPIRPKGYWVHGKELSKEYRGRILVDVTYADWHCSNCNYVIKGTVKPKWNYCPNCGAKMVEPQESEEE